MLFSYFETIYCYAHMIMIGSMIKSSKREHSIVVSEEYQIETLCLEVPVQLPF